MNLRLLPLLCLPFAALAESPVPHSTYTCDDGSRIELSFSPAADGRPQAQLHLADTTLTLPRVPAAIGAFYRNETIRLHIQDEQVVFDDEHGITRHCLLGANGPLAASRPATTPSSLIEVSGQITYRSRRPLPADAELIIRVQDVSRAGTRPRTLAEQRIAVAGQPLTVPFATNIDRDLLGKKSRVTISAGIESAGQLLFANRKTYPAFSDQQAKYQTIELQRVARAK